MQERPVDERARVLAPAEDHIDGVLLECVILLPKPGQRHAEALRIEG